jgi:hypothetical protein
MSRSAAPRIGMPQPPPCLRHDPGALAETREHVRAHKILPRRGVCSASPGTRRRPRDEKIWCPCTPLLWWGRYPDVLGWRVRRRNRLRPLSLESEWCLCLCLCRTRTRSTLDLVPVKPLRGLESSRMSGNSLVPSSERRTCTCLRLFDGLYTVE